MQTSGSSCREIAKLYPRHCERSDLSAVARRAKAEAIHISACRAMDCFASLAMTLKRRGVLDPRFRGDDRRGWLQCQQMAPSETLICPA
jgi:hypothetical protein